MPQLNESRPLLLNQYRNKFKERNNGNQTVEPGIGGLFHRHRPAASQCERKKRTYLRYCSSLTISIQSTVLPFSAS